MPYEDEDDNIDEFANVLALVEDLSHCNSDRHLLSIIPHVVYTFNMSLLSILDHFISPRALRSECMSDVSVFHDIDNLSDHEPLLIHLKIDVTSIAVYAVEFSHPACRWPQKIILMNIAPHCS
jgi:hypothetical protein